MPKPWTIPEQLFLLPPRQVGKSFWAGRTLEGKVAVAIDPGKTHEGFLQLLAAHALDRIASEAIDCSNYTHVRSPFRDAPHKSSVRALLSLTETRSYRLELPSLPRPSACPIRDPACNQPRRLPLALLERVGRLLWTPSYSPLWPSTHPALAAVLRIYPASAES